MLDLALYLEMINHLLSEDERGEEDPNFRDSLVTDSSISRLTSVSRPSWSTPLGESQVLALTWWIFTDLFYHV